MNIQIVQADPTNDELIERLYEYLKANCEFYDFLTYEQFERCRASIYMAFDLDDNGLTSKIPCGIIGVRRAAINDINIKELQFYCQPYKLMYYIEFIHFNPPVLDGQDHSAELEKGYFDLLGCCLKDKNDGFAAFKKYCPTYNEVAIHDALIRNYFLIISMDPKTGVLTYVKEPKMYRYMK